MCAADEPEHTRESECVRCSAGATVGLLILAMGRLLARLRWGDSRAPATLMAALYAEDWAQVGREWDSWVWPQLEDEHHQAVRWRTTAHTMIATTSEALKRQGGSGAPADLVAAGEAGEAPPGIAFGSFRRCIWRSTSVPSTHGQQVPHGPAEHGNRIDDGWAVPRPGRRWRRASATRGELHRRIQHDGHRDPYDAECGSDRPRGVGAGQHGEQCFVDRGN